MAYSIQKRGDAYRIFVHMGYRNGKQVTKTATFRPDPGMKKKEADIAAQEFAIAFEKRIMTGNDLSADEKITFQQYAERWLQSLAGLKRQQTTTASYRALLELHIFPAIGSVRIRRLTTKQLNDLYIDLSRHRKDGKPGGYSKATVKRVHAVISSVLSSAVKELGMRENVANRAEFARTEESLKGDQVFTLEDIERFISALDSFKIHQVAFDKKDHTGKEHHIEEMERYYSINPQLRIFFLLAIFSGCRRGELVALDWSDIDFEKNEIHITKTAAKMKGVQVIKVPKNRTSVRTVTIPAEMTAELRAWKHEQKEYHVGIGDKWKETNCVFIQEDGSRMYVDTPSAAFRKLLRRYNASVDPEERLPEITLHGLRHTSATLMIADHVDIRTVSARLGHAQTSTTMNIYAHALQKADQAAADSLGNLIHIRAGNG